MKSDDYYTLQFLRMIFLLAGVGILLYVLYSEHRDRPSLRWPKVTGTVMLCEKVRYGSDSRSHFAVSIRYNYVVNGASYLGNTIAHWSPNWGDGRGIAQFMAEHPVHAPVEVFYQSDHPNNAVLVPGPDPRNRVLVWGGCVAIVGGAWFITKTRKLAADVKVRAQDSKTRKHTS